MSSARFVLRSSRALRTFSAPRTHAFSSAIPRFASERDRGNPNGDKTPSTNLNALNKRGNDTTEDYRKRQQEKSLNPHLTNTTSTIANEMPAVGKDAPPPELLSATDSKFQPKDSVKENTERMTGGTQGQDARKSNQGIEAETAGQKHGVPGADGEMGVGEMEGAKFKVEPLRRTGEDANTMRARLLYQSRKRGTLESDLLLSTFADTHLSVLSLPQLQQYDLFLDENDWDIYYWATQTPSPTSTETAEGSGSDLATPAAQGSDINGKGEGKDVVQEKDEWKRAPASGEWAQTVGTFKPAYRPVPARWRDSEILQKLREHVKARSRTGETGGQERKGLGMMPDIKSFDQ